MSDLILDVHADAGAYAFREYPVTTVAELAAELQRRGLARALVGSAPAITYCSPQPANEALVRALEALGDDRLRPAAVLNPHYPGALADLSRCRDLGCRALKLYPTYHDFDCTSYETVRLVEQAAAWGWPTLLCVRVEDERHHHPLMKVAPLPVAAAVTLARNVPSATLVLCTAQGGELVSFLQQVEREAAVAELSFIKGPLNAIEDTIEQVGSERLLFGTHLPFSCAQTALAKVREAVIPDEAKANILHRNAERIMGQVFA